MLSSPIVLLWRTRSSLRLQSQEFVSANEKVLQRVHSLEEEESAKRVLKILLWTMLFLVTKDKRSLLLWADLDTPTTLRQLEGFMLSALHFRWNNKDKLPFVFFWPLEAHGDGAGAPHRTHLLSDPQPAAHPLDALELLLLLLGNWSKGLGHCRLWSPDSCSSSLTNTLKPTCIPDPRKIQQWLIFSAASSLRWLWSW